MAILKCADCASYGISEDCTCGGERVSPKPQKFSWPDKYVDYRIKYKKEQGLI